MKWFFLAAGAVLLGIVLALPGPGPDSAIDASPKLQAPIPAAVPVAVTPPAVSVAQAPRPTMVLRGLIYRGKGSAHSHALLDVDGKAQQPLRAGEAIAAGWTLQAIAPDHVIVGNGTDSARLDVVAGAPAAVAAAQPAAGKTVAANAAPLAGFAPGAPPRMLADGKAHERNQRFLQAVQERRTAKQ